MKSTIRQRLLISIQRALLGMIYPEIRHIVVEFNNFEKLKIIYYLDRKPTIWDYDNLKDVSGEVLSDIDFNDVEEICLFSTEENITLNANGILVYKRLEIYKGKES